MAFKETQDVLYFCNSVIIPSGLKTSLTRPKVPQGNKSGAESSKQALLDYDLALPGYYSR